MHSFLDSTMQDLRCGRQSWRVFVSVCAPSFVLTIAALGLQRIF